MIKINEARKLTKENSITYEYIATKFGNYIESVIDKAIVNDANLGNAGVIVDLNNLADKIREDDVLLMSYDKYKIKDIIIKYSENTYGKNGYKVFDAISGLKISWIEKELY